MTGHGQSGWRAGLARRVPCGRWLRGYSREAALADAVAGVTLGLMLVPQSIAYAALADLPVQYGLYTAFMGTLVYVVTGTVKEVSIGPTSLMALLTLQACRGLPLPCVALLTLLSGLIVLLMGLLQLGFLVDLISPSVTSAFTSATALVIVVAQLKGLLGLRFGAETISENFIEIAARWRDVRLGDSLLSIACCTTLLLLRRLKEVGVGAGRARLRRALWLLSIGRNALVVLAASAAAYCLHRPQDPLFLLSGRVEAGLPPLQLPALWVRSGNDTLGPLQQARALGPAVIATPLVMVLANIAIAKAFCPGGRVDASQEMVSLGLCNVAGSLVRAMPACGAFTRSALAASSGVRTPAAGLYSAAITLLALRFLTEYFYFIPKACLSSVLICAVIFMIDVGLLRRLWRADRGELAAAAVTLGAALAATVELGVLAGAAASLALLLRQLYTADVTLSTVKWLDGSACVARLGAVLVYLNTERALRRLPRQPGTLLLDCGQLALLDYTAAEAIERLIKKAGEEGREVIPFNASPAVAARLAAVPRAGALRARAPGDVAAACAAPEAAALLADADVV